MSSRYKWGDMIMTFSFMAIMIAIAARFITPTPTVLDFFVGWISGWCARSYQQ